MNKVKQMISRVLVAATVLTSVCPGLIATTAQTQRRAGVRINEAQVQRLIRRIETRSGSYRLSLDAALDRSRIDGSQREDDINSFVREFENEIDEIRVRSDRREAVAADVESLLDRAAPVDGFMRRNRLTVRAQSDWSLLRTDLNELARLYGVSTSITNTPTAGTPTDQNYPPAEPRPQNDGISRSSGDLTGTYRLDAARSQNPRYVAEQATLNLPSSERQRTQDALLARIEPPEMLAIERRNQSITIASSRASQITFEADGVEKREQTADGRTVRTRAAFENQQLTINSSAGDRYSDFTVTFEPIDANRLRVTRRVDIEGLNQPLTVDSFYNKTANVAQFNIYGNAPRSPRATSAGTGRPTTSPRTTNTDFIVPSDTPMVVVINDTLTTKQSREGDRFTMTVQTPAQFEGAIIEGSVAQVGRSGRVAGRSELSLNFERIRLRDGRTARFAGFIESVRTASGKTISVDNEGSVQEDQSQTRRTAERAAIGTAVGALIGAIAGGGKGAAIGALIGAAGGAGSVYVQGQDDLELTTGTEMTIRASAPRNNR